ncbi:conserved hypothetical protein [Ricinus communis]|uniref:Uncharacterized protein n=1 Tax=Ricinus communis TaxID=3988 RepID=B9TNZ8_RICCO|nr:conserved hypothetical protein [Ricinus communis]
MSASRRPHLRSSIISLTAATVQVAPRRIATPMTSAHSAASVPVTARGVMSIMTLIPQEPTEGTRYRTRRGMSGRSQRGARHYGRDGA